MKKPTKEWLAEEIKKTLEWSVLDDINEYREDFSYLEIAEIFSQTVDKMAKFGIIKKEDE